MCVSISACSLHCAYHCPYRPCSTGLQAGLTPNEGPCGDVGLSAAMDMLLVGTVAACDSPAGGPTTFSFPISRSLEDGTSREVQSAVCCHYYTIAHYASPADRP